jgi:hypothetical protein
MTSEPTLMRAINGFKIANTKYQNKKITEQAFIVKSQSSSKQYVVSDVMGSDNWHCECPDHTYRHVTCKHMFAVQAFIQSH